MTFDLVSIITKKYAKKGWALLGLGVMLATPPAIFYASGVRGSALLNTSLLVLFGQYILVQAVLLIWSKYTYVRFKKSMAEIDAEAKKIDDDYYKYHVRPKKVSKKKSKKKAKKKLKKKK
jgi:hypothetical protein